jgi:uncharacterized protein DUF1731
MTERSLQVTYRKGKPFSAYLHLSHQTGEKSARLILKSRRVVPTRLLQHSFTFKFPTWRDAARDLYQQWKVNLHSGAHAA